jgi:hypothetical protein
MTLECPTDMVIYRSRLNAKINRNFKVFNPTDFLAAIPRDPATRLPFSVSSWPQPALVG